MSENNEELNNEELNIDLGELTPEQLGMMPESEKPQGVTAFIIIKNPDGSLFAIVHQYDRVPEWKNYVYNKYGVETNKQDDYFVYKV